MIEGSRVSAKSIVRELVPPVLWRIMSKIKGLIQGRPSPSGHPAVDPWQGRVADAGLLGADDPRFIETRIPELTGWLDANAAYFSAYMLNAQHAANIKGPVLEIGSPGSFSCCFIISGGGTGTSRSASIFSQTPDRNRS